MPCYTIQTTSLKIENADLYLLKAALEAHGYAVNYCNAEEGRLHAYKIGKGYAIYRDGKLEIEQSEAATIKQEYSAEVVKATAKRFGWTLKQTGDNAFVAQKR